jgi:uncharacterized protein with GYD domain
MVRNPADRAEATRTAIERAGGQMEAFYWMLGDYDGLVVYSMPNETAAAAYSAAVSTSGRLKQMQTHQLLDSSDAAEALALAASLEQIYQPPGATKEWRAEYDALGVP